MFSGSPWLDVNTTISESTSKYNFNLVIPDFQESVKKGSGKRAVFHIDQENEIFLELFELLVYADGSNLKNKGYLSILFQENRMSHLFSDNITVTVVCFISVTDNIGEPRFLQSFTVTRKAGKDTIYPAESYSLFGFERFVKCSTLLNNIDEFIAEGCLTLCCDITIVESFLIDSWHAANVFLGMSCDKSITMVTTPDNAMKYKLNFKTPLFRYLQSESKYFRRIEKIPMKEAVSEALFICNDEYNIFLKLGTFLSIGSLQHIDNIDDLIQLYTIADKYEILRLQHLCAKLLEKQLTFENAADILVLADIHNDQNLKIKVMQYIRLFLQEVKSTVSWTSLLEERKDLAEEVLEMKDRKLYVQQNMCKTELRNENIDNNKMGEKREIEKSCYFS